MSQPILPQPRTATTTSFDGNTRGCDRRVEDATIAASWSSCLAGSAPGCAPPSLEHAPPRLDNERRSSGPEKTSRKSGFRADASHAFFAAALAGGVAGCPS